MCQNLLCDEHSGGALMVKEVKNFFIYVYYDEYINWKLN